MVAGPLHAAARAYEVDPARTRITFTVDATGFARTTGTMHVLHGRLDLEPDDPEQAQIILVLDPASLDTGFAARDEVIRGPSFLDVARFPEIRFTTTAVYPDRGNAAMVLGELDLIGARHPVTIETRLAEPPAPEGPIRFSGTARLSRSDWGMTAFLPLVDDEIEIAFQLTAVPIP